MIVQTGEGFEVCGEASDGRRAVQMALELKPDLLVIDLAIPQLNGLEATRQIVQNDKKIRVLVLTMHESEQVVRDVLTAGARGYILKTDNGRDLISALELLLSGRTFFTSKVAQIVLDSFIKGGQPVSQTLSHPSHATGARGGPAPGRGQKQQRGCRGSQPKRQDRRACSGDLHRGHHGANEEGRAGNEQVRCKRHREGVQSSATATAPPRGTTHATTQLEPNRNSLSGPLSRTTFRSTRRGKESDCSEGVVLPYWRARGEIHLPHLPQRDRTEPRPYATFGRGDSTALHPYHPSEPARVRSKSHQRLHHRPGHAIGALQRQDARVSLFESRRGRSSLPIPDSLSAAALNCVLRLWRTLPRKRCP